MKKFLKISFYPVATAFSYLALTAVFTVYCICIGHNFTEAIYGGFFAFVLAPVLGAEVTMQIADRLAKQV